MWNLWWTKWQWAGLSHRRILRFYHVNIIPPMFHIHVSLMCHRSCPMSPIDSVTEKDTSPSFCGISMKLVCFLVVGIKTEKFYLLLSRLALVL